MDKLIRADKLLQVLIDDINISGANLARIKRYIEEAPGLRLYTPHEVAVIIADLFGDDCACNFNGIDGWLPDKCELTAACPNPVGVACWEQYLKCRYEYIRGFQTALYAPEYGGVSCQ